jgi:putative transposase
VTDKYQNKYRIPSARLQNWDYGWNSHYFVTICTQNRECNFGEIVDGKMQLSVIGEMAQKYWMEIPEHFPFVTFDAFVVMPNHVHGIVVIDKPDNYRSVETLHATSLPPNPTTPSPKNEKMASISPKPGSLSTIIRSYKSVVTKNARHIHADFAWQPRFHDHIIRTNESYQNIKTYINENPVKWDEDKFYKNDT